MFTLPRKTGASIDYVITFFIIQDNIHIDVYYYMYAYIPTSELDQQGPSKIITQ